MKTCDEIRPQLGAYVLGGLEPEEEREVREHLAHCPDCAREYAELAELPAKLDLIEAPACGARGASTRRASAGPPPSAGGGWVASRSSRPRPGVWGSARAGRSCAGTAASPAPWPPSRSP